MHHPYLVCILFGMPSLCLFTFLMFFILSVLPFVKPIFFHMKTDKRTSVTKAVSRLFLSMAISKQLNAAPYLRHRPWQLHR